MSGGTYKYFIWSEIKASQIDFYCFILPLPYLNDFFCSLSLYFSLFLIIKLFFVCHSQLPLSLYVFLKQEIMFYVIVECLSGNMK